MNIKWTSNRGGRAALSFEQAKMNTKSKEKVCKLWKVRGYSPNCRDVIYSDEGFTPADHPGGIIKKKEYNIV